MAKFRDYGKEYAEYHSKPDQRRNRSNRNKARRKLANNGYSLKGKDVDHKNGNPMDNRLSNLRPLSPKVNRGRK